MSCAFSSSFMYLLAVLVMHFCHYPKSEGSKFSILAKEINCYFLHTLTPNFLTKSRERENQLITLSFQVV